MAVEISDADFTIETTGEEPPPSASDTPPVSDTPEAPIEDASPQDAPPVELPEKETEQTEPPATADRNPDGTFKTKKKGPQARIDHVTWEREQARREAATERDRREALERELQTLRTRAHESAAPPTPAPVASDPSDPEPKEADFEDYGKFVKAQARWEARQEFKQQQTQWLTQQQQDATAQFHGHRADQFRGRLGSTPEELAAATEGIHPAVLQLRPSSTLQPGERATSMHAVADALIDSDTPKELMRYWTDHFDDFRRLLTLHPIQVIREVGKHEARLSPAPNGSGSQVPVLSQAKPPIKPVGSAPPAVEDEGSDEEPFEVFVRRENARDAKARRR